VAKLANEHEVWEEAKPYFFEGNQIGVLVLHGFTGCNQSMRPLGEAMAQYGFTVLGPRLPGHGTSVQDMAKRKYTEWTFEAERAFLELEKKCKDVFVTGLSMGGTLTLWLGEKYGKRVAGLIPINAPVFLRNPLLYFAPIAKYILKTVPGVGSDIKDPKVKELCYDKVPVGASHELLKLMKTVKRDLAKVTSPTLIFQSREDHVVNPPNAPYIHEHIGTPAKELVWLENSYHVATLDNDKELIFSRSAEFIKQHAS
jgi:carboxylesterase